MSRSWLRYLWASPATLIGLLAALVAAGLGARWQLVDGVIEVGGGRLARWAARVPFARRFVAITLGHVVLGRDQAVLERHRVHEHTHVRQYERWGLLFFPLYLGASLLELARGRDPYFDNCFEREARAVAARAEQPPP